MSVLTRHAGTCSWVGCQVRPAAPAATVLWFRWCTSVASKPETKLQKAIQAKIRKRKGWVTKIHQDIYSRGVPDLIVCYRGYFVALEVKTPANRSGATPLQAAQLTQVRAAKGLGYVVRSVAAVDRILDALDRREAAVKRALLGKKPKT